jgi:hypothetical protein
MDVVFSNKAYELEEIFDQPVEFYPVESQGNGVQTVSSGFFIGRVIFSTANENPVTVLLQYPADVHRVERSGIPPAHIGEDEEIVFSGRF